MRDVILLFYNSQTLAVVADRNNAHRFFRAADLILADASTTDIVLMALDVQRTPLHTYSKHALISLAFTPFGHTHMDMDISSIGFTGERLDGLSGCYPLGAGYRHYNPVLMRFQSGDSMSPFLKGGVNRYGYCLNDPINRTDPSGHFPDFIRRLGSRFRRRTTIHQEPVSISQTSARAIPPPYTSRSRHSPDLNKLTPFDGDREFPPSYPGLPRLDTDPSRPQGPPPPYLGGLSDDSPPPVWTMRPLPNEYVLEQAFQAGTFQASNSLLHRDYLLSRYRNSTLSASDQSVAITALRTFARNGLPMQANNGIRDAAYRFRLI